MFYSLTYLITLLNIHWERECAALALADERKKKKERKKKVKEEQVILLSYSGTLIIYSSLFAFIHYCFFYRLYCYDCSKTILFNLIT